MEQLIVFLFKNWYLVIIALTFFYQLRSRRKRSKQGTPNLICRPLVIVRAKREGL